MNRRSKLITSIIFLIILFLGASYVYIVNNPVTVNISASVGTTTTISIPITTTSTTTTTLTTTTTSTTTTTTSTTTTSTTTTTTTIPSTTTTVDVIPEKDSVTINDNSLTDPVPYEGIFTDFDGFEGENQILLESFVADLPKVLKNITNEKVLFINGCHLYGVEMLGECPFGVWDSAGTFQNGQTDADWRLSVWVSNRAFRSNRAFDTLLHETSHAFSYLNRNCESDSGENKRKEAQEFFGSEELFADALVLYFGGSYVFYRETNILDSTESQYIQEFINICTDV